jgi:hypothetical protein
MTLGMPSAGGNGKLTAMLAVVALSDILLFDQNPGLNLFLCAMAITVAILVVARRMPPVKALSSLGLSVFASAPLLEAPSPMAIALSVGAIMCTALFGARLLPHRASRVPQVLLRFGLVVPFRLGQDCRKGLVFRPQATETSIIRLNIGAWLMPLALASVFLVLFAIANPLIEDALRSIDLAFLLQFLDFWRIGLWLAMAVFTWAMLRPRLMRRSSRAKRSAEISDSVQSQFLNEALLTRSLIVFNILFAVETVLDLVYLWGGASLPDGMTHAQYAHRGAYPLLATALLAAAFVLVAMRRDGPGDKSPVIRGLVHVWIGQNVLLCLSSMLRLDLYVEAYSLTELRVAAGIWMGLVALGLVWILLRIALSRSNEWLIAMNLASLLTVLYVSAWTDIPAFIARFNVIHSLELSHEGVPLDVGYLSSLGPAVIPALDLYLAAQPGNAAGAEYARSTRTQLAYYFEHRPDDWRSATFRFARLSAYLSLPATIAR